MPPTIRCTAPANSPFGPTTSSAMSSWPQKSMTTASSALWKVAPTTCGTGGPLAERGPCQPVGGDAGGDGERRTGGAAVLAANGRRGRPTTEAIDVAATARRFFLPSTSGMVGNHGSVCPAEIRPRR